jgi:hypothetical protein
VIRLIAAWLALVLVQPALAQPVPAPSPAPAAAPAPPAAKPAQKKPAPARPGGAAAAQPAVPTGPCIGVISNLGDYVAVQRIGVTAFGNEVKDMPVSWGLDELVVARVRAAVGPRFNVRRIAFAKDAFASYEESKTKLFGKPEDNLTAVVQKIAQGSGCERYVSVVRFTTSFVGTNQTVTGIGIVNYGFSGLDRTWLYAVTGIRVYDGRSFAVLKAGAGRTGDRNILASAMGADPVRGPNRKLESFAWPPTSQALTGLREQARSLLAESLDKALPELLAP